MMDPDVRKLRRQIRSRLGRIILRCQEAIAFAEWTATNRPNMQPPLDCEVERVMLQMALRMWEIGDPADPEYIRLSEKLAACVAEEEPDDV